MKAIIVKDVRTLNSALRYEPDAEAIIFARRPSLDLVTRAANCMPNLKAIYLAPYYCKNLHKNIEQTLALKGIKLRKSGPTVGGNGKQKSTLIWGSRADINRTIEIKE